MKIEIPKPDESVDYVCVEFLDRQADQLLAWASKVEKPILSEAYLKRQLRKTTKHSEDDIQLLFAHMKFTGRLCVHSVNSQEDDPELTMCKLASPASKQCDEISVKEKGQFAL